MSPLNPAELAYTSASEQIEILDKDILNFIEKGLNNQDEDEFNRLALNEFKLQYHTVEQYRIFCDKKGVSPGRINHWSKIPAVPSPAFKEFVLASFPIEKAEQVYYTSGTSSKKKGKIFRDPGAVILLKAANGLLSRAFLFPDQDRMKIMLMVPSPKVAPGMGMAIGLEALRTQFGTEESAFLISHTGLDLKKLVKSLQQAESTGEPLALIGATSGFIYFFKACQREGIRFELPPGSRLCDGGGYLGQFGECTREEYLEESKKILNIEPHYCLNVLGMGEISTNFFDATLHNYLLGKTGQVYKVVPPWTRIMVVDPQTLQPLPKGKIGLLRHYDLANRAMILAVQTDNLGYETEDGFEIVGRWRKKGQKATPYQSIPSTKGRMMMRFMDYLLAKKMDKVKKYI